MVIAEMDNFIIKEPFMNIHWKKLILSLAIPLAVGGLAAFLTKDSMPLYETLKKPPLSPPGWLFPAVWTILYILMGISCYLVAASDSVYKQEALQIYGFQLFLNFLWTPIFFNLQSYLSAFFILVILWFFIIKMIAVFYPINKTAAKLQIPYLLWVTFAGYLNAAVYLLNK